MRSIYHRVWQTYEKRNKESQSASWLIVTRIDMLRNSASSRHSSRRRASGIQQSKPYLEALGLEDGVFLDGDGD